MGPERGSPSHSLGGPSPHKKPGVSAPLRAGSGRPHCLPRPSRGAHSNRPRTCVEGPCGSPATWSRTHHRHLHLRGAWPALCPPLCAPLHQEAVLPNGHQLSAHSGSVPSGRRGLGDIPRGLCRAQCPLFTELTPGFLRLRTAVVPSRPNGIIHCLRSPRSDVRSFSALSYLKIPFGMFACINLFIYIANIYCAPPVSSVLVTKCRGQSPTWGDFAPMRRAPEVNGCWHPSSSWPLSAGRLCPCVLPNGSGEGRGARRPSPRVSRVCSERRTAAHGRDNTSLPCSELWSHVQAAVGPYLPSQPSYLQSCFIKTQAPLFL